MAERIVIRVDLPEGPVWASYGGGAYIDLSFGANLAPAEVINVWDHRAGAVEPHMLTASGQPSRRGMRAEVVAWAKANRGEWPEFYAGYLANSVPRNG